MTAAAALQPRRISRRPRAFPAHRRAGRRHRRSAGPAGGHRRGRRRQNRDDGRAGGVAGRQRLRRTRTGAGPDVHPQGRRAAAAPGPVAAGPAGRRRSGRAGRRRCAGRAEGAPLVSTYHAFAGHAAARLRSAAARRARHPAAQRNRVVAAGFRRGQRVPRRPATPTRHRPRSPRWCCGCRVSSPNTWSTPASCAIPTSSWNGWCTPCPPGPTSATAAPASGCCACWPPRPSAPNWCRCSTPCNERMRAAKVMDFGMQMASAARLAATFPQVGEDLREPLPGGAARRVPGHRPCPAGRAVVTVRRWSRRRAGADRGR